MFYSIFDFSEAFHAFVLKLMKNGLVENDDTISFFQYFDWFCNENTESVSDIQSLKEKIAGDKIRNYPKINDDDQMYNITSGVYILPSAKLIVTENKINGYLLDATFRILPFFTTSILMASVFNTGIALEFSFTRTETEEGFSLLLGTLKMKCGKNFEEQIIETDQGTALTSSIKLHKMIHLKCLRYFLKNVQSNICSFHIKELIECYTTL